ncbi:potassium transporter Kup [Lichenibacterium ramalinae]|uniref:Probable potassium transport system protein Kup n=2 Tax=Lichenibacterium ramalinae TaxID=2316527 RepID=A0A4Q2REF1_9HYPH|nr:KUP/HAK/KT family potassium transporter [Lichenibacterium ramalinae]RYB05378.1 potassium transporter Kup [Lichenibacterium ramalinae]
MGLGLAALGIVFGDIGTSPLYTLKTVLDTVGRADAPTVLGILSLLVWTLVVVTTLKYVTVAMSIDNHGEGGILALMALVGGKARKRPVIVAIGLFGAALIYGDGAVTPAISVLSALEGLNMVAPSFQPWVLPAAVAILVALFVIQPFGTATIGKAFGPVMALWFLALAAMGIGGILHHPAVLAALDPRYGLAFLVSGGLKAFLILGGVFLCVTGAEALYADMGHFGSRPIRLSWVAVVFPCLVINYAGQAAMVLEQGQVDGNIFYRLCPGPLLVPLVILATLATIIASQAIITGAFSMTRQAIRLGWMPRLMVTQTSAEGYGQIYVGAVNWLLMLVTLGLALAFRKSDSLASAYGIAVSLTMLMTTVLLFIAMREIWRWSVPVAGAVAGCFLVVDLAFFTSNLVKLLDGGYVPLLLAALVYGVMWVWHRGTRAVSARLNENTVAVGDFTAQAVARRTPRVPGTAVFLTRTATDVPPSLVWHVEHNKALHENIVVLTVETGHVPYVAEAEHLAIDEIAPNFWRARAQYGFMEHPDIPVLLREAAQHGCDLGLDDATYYVGHATIMHRDDGKGLPRWQEAVYAALERNASHVGDVLRLPADRTVELGRQVFI